MRISGQQSSQYRSIEVQEGMTITGKESGKQQASHESRDPYDLDVQVHAEPSDLKREQPFTCACLLTKVCVTLDTCAGNCA
jgi:hypothetical protein